jgi:predicted phosphodiesterase
MRLGLLSDIHGNAGALDVALRNSKCDLYLVCGDIVGYYYETKEVLALLSKVRFSFVRGNHEVMLQNLRQNPNLNDSIVKVYGTSLLQALQLLDSKELDFLCHSKDTDTLKIGKTEISFSHGSPWKIDEYIYPDSEKTIWPKFLSYGEQIFVIGNTHHQMIKRFKDKLIINPGSIGQSRTDPGMAQWAELDTENLDLTFKSVPYDTSRILKSCEKYDPENLSLQKALTP